MGLLSKFSNQNEVKTTPSTIITNPLSNILNSLYLISSKLPRRVVTVSDEIEELYLVTTGTILYNPTKHTEEDFTINNDKLISKLIFDLMRSDFRDLNIWDIREDVYNVLKEVITKGHTYTKETFPRFIIIDGIYRNILFTTLYNRFLNVVILGELFNNSDYKHIIQEHKINPEMYKNKLSFHADLDVKQGILNRKFLSETSSSEISRVIYEILYFVNKDIKNTNVFNFTLNGYKFQIYITPEEIEYAKRTSTQTADQILENLQQGKLPFSETSIPINFDTSKDSLENDGLVQSRIEGKEIDDISENQGVKYNDKATAKSTNTKIEAKTDFKYLSKLKSILTELNNTRLYSYMTPDNALLQQSIIVPSRERQRILQKIKFANIYLDTSVSMTPEDLEITVNVAKTLAKYFNDKISINEFNTKLTKNTLEKFNEKYYSITSRGGTDINLPLQDALQQKSYFNVIITDGEIDWQRIRKFQTQNRNFRFVILVTKKDIDLVKYYKIPNINIIKI